MKKYNFIFGLKAIAVLLIIIDHFVFRKHIYTYQTFPFTFFRDGMNGIFIFFVTSAFLVTKKIDYIKSNNIDYKYWKFNISRLIKILLPLYTYAFIIAATRMFPGFDKNSFDSILTFTFNYMGHPHDNVVMHFWAFCAEEMTLFLLIIPIMYFLNRSMSLITFFLIALASIGVRYYSFYYQTDINSFDWYKYMETHLHLFGFCFGAIVALTEGHKVYKLLFNKLKFHWFAALLLIIISPYLEANAEVSYQWLNKPIVSTFGFAVICAYCLNNMTSLLTKALSNKFFIMVGAIYYSLYIWQQPFTFSWYNAGSGVDVIIYATLLSFATGTAAYFVLEVPLRFIRKKVGLIY